MEELSAERDGYRRVYEEARTSGGGAT
jgi:hypothetical protein